jgi:SAM-dependent methyltransferase
MTAMSRFSLTVRERVPGTAPVTSERLVPGTARTVEGLIMEARHVYAYELALSLARAEMNVLEIGHGEGYGAQMIGAAVASYDGVEVESTAVEHARSWYGRENVRFHLGDGATLPFAANSFDLVVSFQVIEHVRSAPLLLAETARVCRPGALVVMTTPNRHVRLAAGQRPWNRYHVEEYDPDTLRSLLAEHFRDVSVSGVVGNQAMTPIAHGCL